MAISICETQCMSSDANCEVPKSDHVGPSDGTVQKVTALAVFCVRRQVTIFVPL